MRNFLIGTSLIILGAVYIIAFPLLSLEKDWLLIAFVPIVIGGLFQLSAFLNAALDMNDLDFRYKITMAQFGVTRAIIESQRIQNKPKE